MSLFRRSRATWRTGREIFLDCLPAILIFGVLYAFSIIITIMTPGFVPTGWNKSQYEAINALQYGIVGETLKIFSFSIHYPNTTDSETAYLFSWYLAHECIRPLNKTDAIPEMCKARRGWSPVNITSLLEVAESLNSHVPGFNGSVTRPTMTTTVISAAAGIMNSGEAFTLLVLAMILSVFGWFAFWLCPKRWFVIPLGFLGIAMAIGTVAAVMLHTSAQVEKTRIDGINPSYAHGVKVGTLFMGLLWSAAAALTLAFVSALLGLWMGINDDGDYGWRSVNVHVEEEGEIVKVKNRRRWFSWPYSRRTRKLESMEPVR